MRISGPEECELPTDESLTPSKKSKFVKLGSALVFVALGSILTLTLQDEFEKHSFSAAEISKVVVRHLLVALVTVLISRYAWNATSSKLIGCISRLIKFGADKKSTETWKEYFERFPKNSKPDIFGAARYLLSIWVFTNLLLALIGVIFSIVSFLSATAQNQITTRLNEIEAANQIFHMEWEKADYAFHSISEALRNPSSSLELQKHALEELPEVMVTQVHTVKMNEFNRTEHRTHLPNLSRTQSLLIQFMKRERVGEFLGNNGYSKFKIASLKTEDFELLRSMSNVSTELLRCLHRVGSEIKQQKDNKKSSEIIPNKTLWTLRAESFEPHRIAVPAPKRDPNQKHDSNVDISHLGRSDMVALAIPFYRETKGCPVKFPFRGNFHSAHFQYSQLNNANLQGAEFRSANLQKGSFDEADFLAAIFHDSNLMHATFSNAKFEGGSIVECTIDGADFSGSQFGGLTKEKCLKRTGKVGEDINRQTLSGTLFLKIRSGIGLKLARINPDQTITRAHFINDNEAAWMDKAALQIFENALSDSYHTKLASESVEFYEAIETMKLELLKVNSERNITSDIWMKRLSDRITKEGFQEKR